MMTSKIMITMVKMMMIVREALRKMEGWGWGVCRWEFPPRNPDSSLRVSLITDQYPDHNHHDNNHHDNNYYDDNQVEDACHWWMPETDSWELGPKMSRPRYQVNINNVIINKIPGLHL